MKIPKLYLIEWAAIGFLGLSLILSVILILQPGDVPQKSVIENVGEVVRVIEDEFKKGYRKDSIQ